MRRFALLVLLAAPLAAQEPDGRPSAIAQFEDAVSALAEKARPSLVQIAGHFKFGEEENSPEFFVANEFSGMILDAKGHVVTVGTAVKDAARVQVILADGTEFEAAVLGVDAVTNLAVLKIDPGDVKLVPAALADSDRIRPGAFVLALGNPYGLEGSLAHGIVSGTRRTVGRGLQTFTGLLQITAPINAGDAGGLAVNSRGEVIGVLSSTFQRAAAFDDMDGFLEELKDGLDWKKIVEEIQKKDKPGQEMPKDLQEMIERLWEDRKKALQKRGPRPWGAQQLGAEGINFVTPANVVRRVADELIAKGKVDRGFLGIQVAPIDGAMRVQLEIPKGQGVLIVWVHPETPAAAAGLQRADVILEIDGKPIGDIEALAEVVTSKAGGEKVSMKIVRKANQMVVEATLGKK